MNKKEEDILNEIISYFKKNMSMPSIRYLQKKFNYQSTNTIFKYLKSLEQKGYLYKNENNKLIISYCSFNHEKSLKRIKVINRNNKYINIYLEKVNNYLAYQVNNNKLDYLGIIKDDIIILQVKSKMQNGDIGLFIIDNRYKIMRYYYKEGFYVLSDIEEIILNKVKLIGKVILIERKIKTLK